MNLTDRHYKVILGKHSSEKAARVGDRHNQVVFRVMKDATKTEIKRAVEGLFNVSVEKVRVVNIPEQQIRTRRGIGRRPGWRKAYVKLGAGQEINFTGAV